MSLIDLPTAKAHLREEPDYPDEQVVPYLLAAEESAVQFLNRRLYVDASALQTAIDAIPAFLTTSAAAYAASVDAANALTDSTISGDSLTYADSVYRAQRYYAFEVRNGMVPNDAIRAAILLILGDLYRSRESTAIAGQPQAMPFGALALLQPYRASMGV